MYKNLVSRKIIFLIVLLCSKLIIAQDSLDVLGRTSIINFVIQAEENIASLQLQIKELYNRCYEPNCNENKSLKIKASCTHQDIYALDCKSKELKDYIEKTIAQLAVLAREKNILQVKDIYNKTVVDYCNSIELYDLLRSLGAPYQIKQDLYFHGAMYVNYTLVAFMVCAVSAGIFQSYMIDPVAQKAKKEKLLADFIKESHGLAPEQIESLYNQGIAKGLLYKRARHNCWN